MSPWKYNSVFDIHMSIWDPQMTSIVGSCTFHTMGCGVLLRPATPSETLPLDDQSLQVRYGPNRQSPTLTDNHRPYPSIADRHTWASVPVPTLGASTHSLIQTSTIISPYSNHPC